MFKSKDRIINLAKNEHNKNKVNNLSHKLILPKSKKEFHRALEAFSDCI